MLFTSSVFLFLFLPLFLLFYYISPGSVKNFIILLGSLFFYAWGENLFVLVMLLSLTMDYVAGLLIGAGKKRMGLILSLLTNLGLLGFFKYYNFFSQSLADALGFVGMTSEARMMDIALPLGISFYTFQSLSYTIDVYSCLLYTSPSPRDQRGSRMPSSA